MNWLERVADYFINKSFGMKQIMANRYIKKLKALVPPPPNPPGTNVNWQLVEGVLQLEYPAEFKEFIATYGSLRWFDLFKPLYCQGDSNEECLLFKNKRLLTLSNLTASKQELISISGGFVLDSDGKRVCKSMAAYPDSGGMFPFIQDIMGDSLCWKTEGEPSSWRLIKWYVRGDQIIEYEPGLTFTELLCNWLEQIPPHDKLYPAEEFAKPAFD